MLAMKKQWNWLKQMFQQNERKTNHIGTKLTWAVSFSMTHVYLRNIESQCFLFIFLFTLYPCAIFYLCLFVCIILNQCIRCTVAADFRWTRWRRWWRSIHGETNELWGKYSPSDTKTPAAAYCSILPNTIVTTYDIGTPSIGISSSRKRNRMLLINQTLLQLSFISKEERSLFQSKSVVLYYNQWIVMKYLLRDGLNHWNLTIINQLCPTSQLHSVNPATG